MASMTIHHLDDQIQDRLRARASLHGHSMEDEAREILRSALSADSVEATSFVQSVRSRIEPMGGIDLDLPPREVRHNAQPKLGELARRMAEREVGDRFGDPIAWQRSERQDRPLPERES